jgi:hypothetical protein
MGQGGAPTQVQDRRVAQGTHFTHLAPPRTGDPCGVRVPLAIKPTLPHIMELCCLKSPLDLLS